MLNQRRIVGPMTTEMINSYFQNKPIKIETICTNKICGRPFNVDTQQVVDEIPHYNPPTRKHQEGSDYATKYKRMELNKMLNSSENPPSIADHASGIECLASDKFSIGTGLHTAPTEYNVAGTRNDIQLPEGMTMKDSVQVFERFKFDAAFNTSLPTYAYKKEILEAISSDSVTIIQGDTGSGKTTQVPQYILEEAACQNKYCNIIVTQPRRIAAISVALRVAQERGWQPGTMCAYQVGLDRNTTNDTRLLYCTTGVLLNQLINKKSMNGFTHVILDEVHERDQDMDFCLIVVRKFLWSNSPNVKVVLMSATVDSLEISKYFLQPCLGTMVPAKIIKVEGQRYAVQEFYLEQLESIRRIPHNLEFTTAVLHKEIVELAVCFILKLDVLENKPSTSGEAIKGSVLVFLPGLEHIEDMCKRLEPYAGTHGLILRPLHSSITSQEQCSVFDKPPPSKRKIILATNIAESSITVADVKYVIDFCLTKNLMCNQESNYSSLQLQWAAKSNCIQRKGRAGRVGDGRVYRMIPFNVFQHFIDYQIPEILRSPLEQLVLKTKLLDLGEPKAILGLAIVPPDLRQIESTILLLKEMGALSSNNFEPYDGDLTFLGQVVGTLPMSVKLGKLIMLGHVFGFLEECIIISACHSVKSIFSQPLKFRLQGFQRKMAWSDASMSDSITYLNAYKTWFKLCCNGHFRTQLNEASWCKKNFLEINKLKEVSELVKEVTSRLSKFNIVSHNDLLKHGLELHNYDVTLLLKLIMCGAFYPNYFTQQYVDYESSLKDISGYNPTTTVIVHGLPMHQGELYRKEMEQLFKICSPSEPLQIHYQNTKSFIQFKGNQSQPNEPLLAVITAIKMRELRFNNLTVKSNFDDTLIQNIEKLSITNEDITGSAVLPTFSEEIISLTPTNVVGCGHFWAKYSTKNTFELYNRVHENIKNHFASGKIQPAKNLKKDEFCLAVFKDGLYYRAKVIEIDYKFKISKLFYIDWGNYEEVSTEDLFPITPALSQFRPMAFECKLMGIGPSKILGNRWSLEATHKFNQYLDSAEEIFAKVYSVVDDVVRILLTVRLNGQHVNLNERLCEDGYATACEESIFSKKNHEERVNGALKLKLCDPLLDSETPMEFRPMDLHLAAMMKEKQMVQEMIKKDAPSVVKLRGPYSPFEVKFSKPFSKGSYKPMRVDGDSVNFVTLECDKEANDTSPLMLAAFVGLNPNENVVIAKDTTILPPIIGLTSLMTLLFAPVAEMRTDKLKQQYTGALCGIGHDENNASLYPEHDNEVIFDFKFDESDLKNINHIRLAINMALEKDNGWPTNAVLKYQQISRKKLLDLVNRPRELMSPQSFHHPFKWNQVDQSSLLRWSQDETALMRLHDSVQLNEKKEGLMTNSQKVEHQSYLDRKSLASWNLREEVVCLMCDVVLTCASDLKSHLKKYSHCVKLNSNLK